LLLRGKPLHPGRRATYMTWTDEDPTL